jgi:hypothetical protein
MAPGRVKPLVRATAELHPSARLRLPPRLAVGVRSARTRIMAKLLLEARVVRPGQFGTQPPPARDERKGAPRVSLAINAIKESGSIYFSSLNQDRWSLNHMFSTKRLGRYLLGAGLALSVAAFAPAAFAQSGGGAGAGGVGGGAGGASAGTSGGMGSSANGAYGGTGTMGGGAGTTGSATSPSGPISGSGTGQSGDDASAGSTTNGAAGSGIGTATGNGASGMGAGGSTGAGGGATGAGGAGAP